MKAVVVEKLGDPTLPLGSGVMRLAIDWPVKPLKPGFIRIKVVAASVNYADPLTVKVRACLVCSGFACMGCHACMLM